MFGIDWDGDGQEDMLDDILTWTVINEDDEEEDKDKEDDDRDKS